MGIPAPDVVVVGAGAAGIFASMAAASSGAKVLLLEKTPRIGTKILISGGGKCNIAHDGNLGDVIRRFPPAEAQFLRPSCYRMTNRQIMDFFRDRGLELYTRPDGRVFPTEGTAKDVVAILTDELLASGVQVTLNTAVSELVVSEARILGVKVESATPKTMAKPRQSAQFGARALLQEVLSEPAELAESWSGESLIGCEMVVVTCGGSSYPNSGTTGDGWKWARAIGHSVEKPRAALAPIYLKSPWASLTGVSLEGCILAARADGKRIAHDTGDLLFTHLGVSGPAALEISRSVALAIEVHPVILEIDLRPEAAFQEILEEINTLIGGGPRRTLTWLLSKLVPLLARETLGILGRSL